MARAIKRTPLDHLGQHLGTHFHKQFKNFIHPILFAVLIVAMFALFNVFQNTQNNTNNNGTYNGKTPVEGNVPLVASTKDDETPIVVKKNTPAPTSTPTEEKAVEPTAKPVSTTPKKVNEAVVTPAKTVEIVKPTPKPKIVEAKPTPKPTPSPIPTETPAYGRIVIPYMEVRWEEIRLPALETKHDILERLIFNENGKIIDAYRNIGPANNGNASIYSHWQSQDYGKTWVEVETNLIVNGEGPYPEWFDKSFGSGHYSGPYYVDNKEELIRESINPLKDLIHYKLNDEYGNVFLISTDLDVTIWRAFLFIQKKWYQINFPAELSKYDLKPETSLLTVLNEDIIRKVLIIPNGKDSTKIILMPRLRGVYWQLTVQ